MIQHEGFGSSTWFLGFRIQRKWTIKKSLQPLSFLRNNLSR